MSSVSKIYYRYVPDRATKIYLTNIHRNIDLEVNTIENEFGSIIQLFTVGSMSSSFIEIVKIESLTSLSSSVYEQIISRIYNLEIQYSQTILKNSNNNFKIHDLGIEKTCHYQNSTAPFSLTTLFSDWNRYQFRPNNLYPYRIVNTAIPKECDVSFIGYFADIADLLTLKKFIIIKLYEQLWEIKNSSEGLNLIREKGGSYSIVSKYHEDLGIFLTGVICTYTQNKEQEIVSILRKITFSKIDLYYAKLSLEKNLLVSSSLNKPSFTLFPFWLYNKDLHLEDISTLIKEIDLNDIYNVISTPKFICGKVGDFHEY